MYSRIVLNFASYCYIHFPIYVYYVVNNYLWVWYTSRLPGTLRE